MAEDEMGGAPDAAPAGGSGAPDVSREARLLAEALAVGLGRGPERSRDEDGAGHGPRRGEERDRADGGPGAAPLGEVSGLAEVLAGAGLLARGGLELLGSAMARWTEATHAQPDPARADAAQDADPAEPQARGWLREPSYRRTPRRPIPVEDDPRRTDLA